MKKLFANHEVSYMNKGENVHSLYKPDIIEITFLFYKRKKEFSSEHLNGDLEEIEQRAEDFAVNKPTVKPVEFSGVKIGHSLKWNL